MFRWVAVIIIANGFISLFTGPMVITFGCIIRGLFVCGTSSTHPSLTLCWVSYLYLLGVHMTPRNSAIESKAQKMLKLNTLYLHFLALFPLYLFRLERCMLDKLLPSQSHILSNGSVIEGLFKCVKKLFDKILIPSLFRCTLSFRPSFNKCFSFIHPLSIYSYL